MQYTFTEWEIRSGFRRRGVVVLPNDGRRGCITLEERIQKLLVLGHAGAEELEIYRKFFGDMRIQEIEARYKAKQAKLPDYDRDEGWVLVHSDESDVVDPADIEERGSLLPGGSQYLKLRSLKKTGCLSSDRRVG
jgi:hypothetical protein